MKRQGENQSYIDELEYLLSQKNTKISVLESYTKCVIMNHIKTQSSLDILNASDFPQVRFAAILIQEYSDRMDKIQMKSDKLIEKEKNRSNKLVLELLKLRGELKE